MSETATDNIDAEPRQLWRIRRAAVALDVSEDQTIRLARKHGIKLYNVGSGSRQAFALEKADVFKLQRAMIVIDVKRAVSQRRKSLCPSRYSSQRHNRGVHDLHIA